MRNHSAASISAVLSAILAAHLSAQSVPLSERARQIKELNANLRVVTPEDAKRVTPQYANATLSRIRRIVQDQALEALNAGGGASEIRTSMQALLGMRLFGASSGAPFVYVAKLQGTEVMVTGYEQVYGGQGIPEIRVMIDGYRKIGPSWELAAEESDRSLDGSDLNLQQLSSPRSNEAWFLAHGHIIGASRYLQPVRIYSFDGYSFNTLWAPERPKWTQLLKWVIRRRLLRVPATEDGDPLHRLFRDTVALSIGGPVVSTAEASPPPVK